MARTLTQEHRDILKTPPPEQAPWLTDRRIGIHTSTSGGVETAAERAWRLGCNTLQVFSSSPRQWKPYALTQAQCSTMREMLQEHDLKPLVVHAGYLLNLAANSDEFYAKTIAGFRGEVERALALGAEYLVVHPGSFRGGSREEGLARAAKGIRQATAGLDLPAGELTILIENTAGSEFSLGGSFEQVAALVALLREMVPCAACLDTCHMHVAGYDIVTAEGYAATLRQIDQTVGLRHVPVWHCNDARAACGSHLDRHEQIGRGTIGLEPFRRLLNDPMLKHAAFIAETPIDEPGDDLRNVEALKRLVEDPVPGHEPAAAKQGAQTKPRRRVGRQ